MSLTNLLYKYLTWLMAASFLIMSIEVAATESSKPERKHCQPVDTKCLNARSAQPFSAPKEGRTYDEMGRVKSETKGNTTTYYTYDENGKQKQQYEEKIVTEQK